MSGLVVIYGPGERSDLDAMSQKMAHRGPCLTGKFDSGAVLMGQNYLRGDLYSYTEGVEAGRVPVGESGSGNLHICYDGQMGNWTHLSRNSDVPDDAFREERLLLSLYRWHGSGMLDRLDDAIFAFVISDGDHLFAARDLLGIKTLFYGWKNGALCLASELKSLRAATEDVNEFPPGHFMDEKGQLTPFASLPQSPPPQTGDSPETAAATIADIVDRSLRSRIDFSVPTGSLLSGGIDSSVIATLASRLLRESAGPDARLKTFAVGVGVSQDIINARLVAGKIQSEHHELIVDLDEMLAVLPEVIYHLESFDPSLVRSSVSNFLISKYAREKGIDVLLSGEGGDEVFCGYMYLKKFPLEELFARQMECIGFLHSNASLRLDRMNHCNSVRVVAPLISGELLRYAMTLPPEYKQRPENGYKIEKWIFRKAFAPLLPDEVAWRIKQEFSQGSGSADVLPAYFEKQIGDDELARAQSRYPMIRGKEELSYFRIFVENFGDGQAVDTVGQWISL
jgi:asparagine synthase (glutamine-hydrolysing)